MNNDIYHTKMKLVILVFVSLFLAILISTSIADHVIPVDAYSDSAQVDNIKNQCLSSKLLFISWGSIILLGLICMYFRNKKKYTTTLNSGLGLDSRY